eukprot:Selendium_serpulae@DN10026_c0_g1_i1.p1
MKRFRAVFSRVAGRKRPVVLTCAQKDGIDLIIEFERKDELLDIQKRCRDVKLLNKAIAYQFGGDQGEFKSSSIKHVFAFRTFLDKSFSELVCLPIKHITQFLVNMR